MHFLSATMLFLVVISSNNGKAVTEWAVCLGQFDIMIHYDINLLMKISGTKYVDLTLKNMK